MNKNSVKIRVAYADTDAMGIVYHTISSGMKVKKMSSLKDPRFMLVQTNRAKL